MSEFGAETVRKIANLARLELTESEIQTFSNQLGKVLSYIEKLEKLDVSQVKPLTNPLDRPLKLRSDEQRQGTEAQHILESAPEQLYENYKVPVIIS